MSYAIPGKALDSARKQVFPYWVNGERVYVKKRRPDKNPLGRYIQHIVYRLTGNLLAIPPHPPTCDNVTFETTMLRRLGELGVRVPRVLHVENKYFVMSDVGETLETILRRRPKRRLFYQEQAARQLRCFHDLGLAHGGALIRNITLLDKKIHFIDFEENIPAELLELFQLRDVFLFIMSIERNGFNPDLPWLCAAYDGNAEGATLEKIRRALLKMRLTRVLDCRIFSFIKMGDIRTLNRLIRKAEAIPPKTS